MSFVSAASLHRSREAACPSNGRVGKRVELQTVKAMLNLPLDILGFTEYRFCADPDCPTVYYRADGSQEFKETDLRERVYQKHPADPQALVCYCFQHTLGNILDNGKTVYARIDRGVRDGQCACDIRNPQGSCCLGNIGNLVKAQLEH